jgi:N-acetylglutamate synthase-like GNAT family acetyltransferase
MDTGVLVREATQDEVVEIAKVLQQAFAEFEALYTIDGFAATVISQADVARRMDEGPVWVALRNATIAGTASAVLKGERGLYVRGVAVVPQSRGSGIASALLREVESFARTENCRRMFLTTTPFLDSAIQLYKRWGFTRVPDGNEDLFGTPLFTMAKNLDG